jgi:hypothetical protein
MNANQSLYFISIRFLRVALLAVGFFHRHAVADSISFDPPEANALTPMTVIVDGFIGSNGPVTVEVNGGGISTSCNSTRPCTFQANMGYFSGKQWVVASALVNGVNVTVSNYFLVRDAKAFINRACGTNGTKIIVSGYDFGRNQTVYSDGVAAQANSNGVFAVNVTLNAGIGPYNIVSQDGFHFATNRITITTNSVCEEEVGHATGTSGGPTVTPPGGQPQPLKPGDPLHVGDMIQTGAGSSYRMSFSDGSTLTLPPNGKFTLNSYMFDPANGANDNSFFSALQGAFVYAGGLLEKDNHNAGINTAYGSIGIRGTEFISRRDPCSTTQEVYLIHGQLAVKPINSTVTNIVNAPATIFYDATNVTILGLTQAAYDALKNEINQTNPVTFASWQVQYFGCTNGNAAATATADPDGDGQNNYAEFLTHTDPTTNASVFRMVSATREGSGVRLAWQTHGGITNVAQAAPSLAGSFADISSNFIIPGDVDVTTNYLDPGAITNTPARFYRIRLAQ